MAMENRLATRREGGDPNPPRVGTVAAADNDNEDDKVYYGFGVFMGLPLADLKAMKDDFVEQQALTGGPPRRALPSDADAMDMEQPRRALPSSGAMDGRAHRVEEEDGGFELQEDARMAPPHEQQQRLNGYERPRGEGDRYAQGPPNGAENGEDDELNSDDGSDYGHKSHSLNFILH